MVDQLSLICCLGNFPQRGGLPLFSFFLGVRHTWYFDNVPGSQTPPDPRTVVPVIAPFILFTYLLFSHRRIKEYIPTPRVYHTIFPFLRKGTLYLHFVCPIGWVG